MSKTKSSGHSTDILRLTNKLNDVIIIYVKTKERFMIKEYESIQGDNLEEADMAQLLSVTQNDDAVARVRAAIPNGPSQSHCEECGEEIPKARQLVVKGCKTCIDCQNLLDRIKKNYGQ